MLDIDQLTHRYGSRVVLNSVSAQLPANGISMLVGDNGAGKTTLLRIILGILRPTAGSVRWHGQPIRPSARDTFPVFDTPAFHPRLTGLQNARTLAPDCDISAVPLLSTEQLRTPVGELSHGQRMRLSLMLALGSSARLLLLDEPATGLDRSSWERVREALLERSRTSAIVVTGHIAELYAGMATTTVHQADGKLTTGAKPCELV